MKFITWYDVETTIYQKMFEGLWPEGMIGVSVYPDEILVRIKNVEDQKLISEVFYQWFGARFDKTKSKLYLEFSANGEKRSLKVAFEVEPGGERFVPGIFKPNFASFSLYPENIQLKGPDFSKLTGMPSIWAFYSFKGGVGRTLHLISMVKALSEQDPSKKVLIVDADLEAPGLTWWADEQYGKPDISFLDFLALAHYDDSPDYANSMKITAENLLHQMFTFETREKKVEHFFLPAFREVVQLMRMPIRPENVCWESGKEWLIPELLWKLGKTLGVDVVVVDLRAGLTEISSSFLFDPRINRFIVTTPSGQSLEGTKQVLKQIKKISNTLKKNDPGYDERLPTIVLSMVQDQLKGIPDFDEIKEQLVEYFVTEGIRYEELLEKEDLVESLFDSDLLYLKNLKTTLEKLDRAEMHQLMSRIVKDRFLFSETTITPPNQQGTGRYKNDLEKLRDIAKQYEYAESGNATDFLITHSLKTLARKYKTGIPAAVIMGAKGSGKTYTYFQLAHLKRWHEFIRKTGETETNYDCIIWPILASSHLGNEARNTITQCRQHAIETKKNAINFTILQQTDIQKMIDAEIDKRSTNISNWLEFWLLLMAKTLSCDNDPNPLAAMQRLLSVTDTRIIFQWDGLESYFPKIGTDAVQQAAIQALCQSVINAVLEWPDNRIGLLVFIRKDMARSSIKQNFGQFESLYRSFEIEWDREEALRLAAWLVNEAAGLKKYVAYQSPIESVSGKAIEEALKGLWGIKMGPLKSREAFSANWVLAALSDFNGQLQARDLVRLIHYAAEKALILENPPGDRLLPPSAIKNALDPCSFEKIIEIQTEITDLKEIFAKLKNVPPEKKQVPFDINEYQLNSVEIESLTKLGTVKEYEGKYYFPEIIRRGLGFTLTDPGRLKVLTLLKRSMNK
ncbi:MAG: hypothetical protein MUF15_00485 [Acidobacteria bacterium]|jgi:cellulose biosynthesis protein BcsQ|nr:hypothetical protein [Acidobacteriota bacterium]